jgi:hypothetical protein
MESETVMTSERPNCDPNTIICPAIRWADEEIARLRAALKRIVDSRDDKNWRKPELVDEAARALA